ncbi:MAG: zinc metallopeptidase, partial [Clostridia bacterium]|nr:zinc metallopeptidase [Clostridia bacterium]
TSSCVLSETETKGARQVLSAAAQTYVASLVVSILSFLRFILSILLTREE